MPTECTGAPHTAPIEEPKYENHTAQMVKSAQSRSYEGVIFGLLLVYTFVLPEAVPLLRRKELLVALRGTRVLKLVYFN